jgi:hypothetical protein
MKRKLVALFGAVILSVAVLTGCQQESDVAAYNVSQAAHNFEVMRRVVFYNGITGITSSPLKGFCP